MDNLLLSLLQTDLVWENKQANLEKLGKMIGSCESDLIVLPEMFSTGFSMNPERFAEEMDGPTIKWMKKMSSASDSFICGSLIIQENGNYYNRFILISPSGNIQTYDKRHLFRLTGEQEKYQPGKEKKIFKVKGWRIAPYICYDLRFPVFSRNQNDTDLMIYVANWPEKRIKQWKLLLPARAVENQCYVVGVNRTGQDGNGFSYTGDSSVIDPKGETVCTDSSKEIILSCQLDYKLLQDYRAELPFQQDADRFTIG